MHRYFGPETAAWDSDEGAIVFYDDRFCGGSDGPSRSYWLVPGTEFPAWED